MIKPIQITHIRYLSKTFNDITRSNFRFSSIKKLKISSSDSVNESYTWGEDRLEDIKRFQHESYKIVDLLCSQLLLTNEESVMPKEKPNFLRKCLQKEANSNSESFSLIRDDLKNNIVRGLTRFDHKGYLSWFPSMTSLPGIMGNMISNSFPTSGLNKSDNQLSYEFERYITEWFKNEMKLPHVYSKKNSGSLIYHGAGYANISSAMAAKRKAMKDHNAVENPSIIHKFRYYISEQAHYSMRKACNIAGSRCVIIPVKYCSERKNIIMDCEYLENIIKQDISNGLIPIYIGGTLGTTGTTAMDDFVSLGKISKKYNIWFHVDGAYAGTAALLDEYSWILNGIELTNSFSINPVKLLPVLQNSAICYFTDIRQALCAYDVDKLITKNISMKDTNYTDLEMCTSRINKAFKIYVAINTYGVQYMKDLLHRVFSSTKLAEKILCESGYFEILYEFHFGLTCFRLRNKNDDEQYTFINKINESGKLVIGPMVIKRMNQEDLLIIRLSINWLYTNENDVRENMKEILDCYSKLYPQPANYRELLEQKISNCEFVINRIKLGNIIYTLF